MSNEDLVKKYGMTHPSHETKLGTKDIERAESSPARGVPCTVWEGQSEASIYQGNVVAEGGLNILLDQQPQQQPIPPIQPQPHPNDTLLQMLAACPFPRPK